MSYVAESLARPRFWIPTLIGTLTIGALSLVSCSDDARNDRRQRSMIASAGSEDVYLRSVSATLNDLAGNIDLQLQPAQPILTASSSADGKEVRAVCIENPNSPDGAHNYLLATDGNAKFMSMDVQPGDIVRYYVNLDEESAERGIEQRTSLELRVRRLDARDPENALIVEGGLDAPAVTPQRIEIWRYSDKRMDAIRSALNRYVRNRLPPIGWEPTPDQAAMQQIVERANQWLRDQRRDAKWKREPLLTEVLASVAKLPPPKSDPEKTGRQLLSAQLSSEGLRDAGFADWESRLLAEAVWMRDVAQWARGSAASDSDVAAALFDWTIRNVQLDPPDSEATATIHRPWQALMYGHGSAAHRAWVFVELCRQQRIDAVLIQGKAADPKAAAPLLVAVAIDDQLQLFDPQLGLALPGRSATAGTLQELAADDALLRQFDVEGRAYPLSAEQLQEVEALIVASPLQLSERARLVEQGLEGENFIKLAAEVQPLVERITSAKHPQVKSVKLWQPPFTAILDEHTIPLSSRQRSAAEFAPLAERPLLWKARVLHFQGNKEVRSDERDDPLARPRQGHVEAVNLYHNRQVRPTDAELSQLEPDARTVRAAGKAAAGYWLGLLSFDRGNYEVALEWLGERTLNQQGEGAWAAGARYNLARTYEAMGNVDEAVRLLESEPEDAPQRHGNLLRARRLKAAKAPAPAAAEAAPAE